MVSEPASDSKRKSDSTLPAESGQRLDRVVADRRQAQSFRLEFRDPTLQPDQLRFAVGSPICRTVKYEHGTFGPHDRLKVPGLPALIPQAKVWDPFANLGTEFGQIDLLPRRLSYQN